MKAERRHELKTNTLALAMQRMPELWRKYGTKLLLAVLVVGIVVVVVINRVSASRERVRVETQSLAIAHTVLDELRHADLQARFAPPEELAAFRRQTISEAERFVTPLVGSDNPRVRTEGLIALGDLRWLQATLPELPGAAENPELQTAPDKTHEQLIAEAEQAYQQVLDHHADQTFAAVSARFGLAAIAENRRQWDVARQHYQTIADDEAATLAFREQARIRLEMLEQIQQPMLIGRPAIAAAPPPPVPGLTLDPLISGLDVQQTPPPIGLDGLGPMPFGPPAGELPELPPVPQTAPDPAPQDPAP